MFVPGWEREKGWSGGRSLGWINNVRVFLENASDNICSVVDDYIDVSVDRDSLGSGGMKFAQRSGDVEFEGRSALLLQFIELGKGSSTGGRDNFVPALQQCEGELFSESGAGWSVIVSVPML